MFFHHFIIDIQSLILNNWKKNKELHTSHDFYCWSSMDYDWTAYWIQIYVAARDVHHERNCWLGVTTSIISATCTLAGTLVLPGIGSVLGLGIGVMISWWRNQRVWNREHKTTWWHILQMNSLNGRDYAHRLYDHHQQFLTHTSMKSWMRQPWKINSLSM